MGIIPIMLKEVGFLKFMKCIIFLTQHYLSDPIDAIHGEECAQTNDEQGKLSFLKTCEKVEKISRFSETRPNPGRSSIGDEARGEHDIRLRGCQLDWTNALSGGNFLVFFFNHFPCNLESIHPYFMNHGTYFTQLKVDFSKRIKSR